LPEPERREEYQVGRIGVAVIGAGGENIATGCHLPALKHVPEMELRLLHDVNEEGVRRTAQTYGVDWTTNFEDVLTRDDIDLVQICSPDPFHASQSVAALDAGKHVLCQKPLALSVEELESMSVAAVRSEGQFQGCQHRRYEAWARASHAAIQRGDIGEPVYGRFQVKGRFYPYPQDSFYRTAESGGQFVHNGMHYVDVLCYLMDTLPVEVFARSARHYPTADRLESDNYLSCMTKMENGAQAWIELNLMMVDPPLTPAEERVIIIGTQGTLRLGNEDNPNFEAFTPGGSVRTRVNPLIHVANPFVLQFREFAHTILTGRPNAIPFHFSARVMETCLAAVESAGTGEPVKLRDWLERGVQ